MASICFQQIFLLRSDTFYVAVVVFLWRLPWPLLRDVSRAEPVSPQASPLASPKEALGSLQAPTAALLEFIFRLERYGDPTHS